MNNEAEQVSVQTYVGECSEKKYFIAYAVIGQKRHQAKTYDSGDKIDFYYNREDAETKAAFATRIRGDKTQRDTLLYKEYSKYAKFVVCPMVVWMEY